MKIQYLLYLEYFLYSLCLYSLDCNLLRVSDGLVQYTQAQSWGELLTWQRPTWSSLTSSTSRHRKSLQRRSWLRLWSEHHTLRHLQETDPFLKWNHLSTRDSTENVLPGLRTSAVVQSIFPDKSKLCISFGNQGSRVQCEISAVWDDVERCVTCCCWRCLIQSQHSCLPRDFRALYGEADFTRAHGLSTISLVHSIDLPELNRTWRYCQEEDEKHQS